MKIDNNAVLISIRPEWCLKILNGEKTVEIRKTRPKLKPPFKCYIYCTKTAGRFAIPSADGKPVESAGKVIGEFTCDKIRFYSGKSWLVKEDIESVTAGSCLSFEQVKEYAGWRKAASFMDRKDLYAWHISNLKVYDTPMELSRLSPACLFKGWRGICKVYGKASCEYQDERFTSAGGLCAIACKKRVERAPQSWCYVEESLKDAEKSDC